MNKKGETSVIVLAALLSAMAYGHFVIGVKDKTIDKCSVTDNCVAHGPIAEEILSGD